MSTVPAHPRAVRLRRLGALASVLFLVALGLYLKVVPCAFALLFHVPCPACGSTRAVLALLQGDLSGALRFNPFGPVVAFLLALLGVRILASVSSHGDLRDVGKGWTGRALTGVFALVALLEVAFWIARFCGAFGGPVAV